MFRRLVAMIPAAVFVSVAAAQTQSGGSSGATSLADRDPSANVRSGAVAERSPSNVVRAALQRHRELTAARLAFQRGDGELGEGGSTGGTAGGSSGGSGGGGLFGGLLGDIVGSGITDLLGGLGGMLGGSSGGTTGNSGGAGTGNPNIPSNITPEVIALLEQFGIDINDVFPSAGTTGSGSNSTGNTGGSLPNIRSKLLDRAQATGGPAEQQPKFVIRWANELLSAMFDAINAGIRLNAFVDLLENLFRPLLIPDSGGQSQDANQSSSVRVQAPPATAAGLRG